MKEKIKDLWKKFKESKIYNTIKKVGCNLLILSVIVLLTIVLTAYYVTEANKPVVEPPTPDPIIVVPDTNPTISYDYVSAFLAEDSELSTGRLKIQGFLDYKAEGGVPWLTQTAFGMLYDVELRAGIRHLNDVNVEYIDEENRKIAISIPEVEILGAEVIPDSIKYISEKFVLFPSKEKEHVVKAIAEAKKHSHEYAKTTGILDFAEEHAKNLIRNLYEGKIYDFTVEFVERGAEIPGKVSSENVETTEIEIQAET